MAETKTSKVFILDTNVLLQSAEALYRFEDNDIIIPTPVLEELDKKKKDDTEAGRNAREAIRILESLRSKGSLLKGVQMEQGGILTVAGSIKNDFDKHTKTDDLILEVCRNIVREKGSEKTILVTKDILLRVKAEIAGIAAEDFLNEKVTTRPYTGRMEAFVPEESFKNFREKGCKTDEAYTIKGNTCEKEPAEFYPNQFVVLKGDQSMKTQLGRVCGNKIVKLDYENERPYGVKPRNQGQYMFQEALMQPADKAPCVIATGPAGSAKTFYSLAVGLEQIYNAFPRKYRRILICRPNAAFESEGIGYLPGDENEKIAPLMRPIIDNLEILLDSDEDERYKNEKELAGKIEEIFARDIIRTEALNYIRGRSLVDTFLIIDEAQNCTPAQAKGILTRAGKGTKVIMLGDPKQIDKPYLDEQTNGLSYAMDRMKHSSLAWQIAMEAEECERSELALDAASRL